MSWDGSRVRISRSAFIFVASMLLLSPPSSAVAYRPGRLVLIPIEKPTGYTGADPYKISFQVGREKFLIPWLFLVNPKSSEVPMIDVHLRYSGSNLHGVTAKVIDMPYHYVEVHQNIRKHFWDPQHWPKHILIRYTWLDAVLYSLNLHTAVIKRQISKVREGDCCGNQWSCWRSSKG